MKNKLFFLLVFTSVFISNAQSYMGYFPDNYAGVQGVLSNPATIVDSRFKTDINLFSVSTSVNNDFYGVSLFDLGKDSYDVERDGIRKPSENNGGIAYADVMGPSFMFNIAPKHAIAIFTRARAVANITNANGKLYDQLKDGLDDTSDFDINVGDPNIVGHTWGEMGLSYAVVLLQNKQHFLKGGLTLKYLQGGVNAYAQGSNLQVDYDDTGNLETSTLTTQGTLTIGSSQDVITNSNSDTNDIEFDSSAKGMGIDIGFVYEIRPDYEDYDLAKAKPTDNNFKDLNKYKFRFGASVTDIGSINYKNSKVEVYDMNTTVTQDFIDAANDLDELLALYNSTPVFKDVKVNLPTALHLDVDWNIHNKFYLNLNGNVSVTDKSGLNSSSIANTYILTPRYETRWFTFSVPINYMEYSGMQVGTGLRFGPLFVGSSSVLTNLVSKESKAADVYFGFKIPVYQKKFKDKDGDGVLDKKDNCRIVPGPIENKGCPWPDTDGDTVVDKDDKCPSVTGPVENKGCPWGDEDKDTVLDNVDACPSVAGPVENKGCPWPDTDGDSVLDKDDKCPNEKGSVANAGCPDLDADKDGVIDKEDNCPTVPGPVSNKGCPEVTKEVLKELKVQARSVFFVTGKAVLQTADKGQTDGRLDAIKEIIKDYPNAKFSIEGHTDNVGSNKVNQKLSEERAKVVMDALIAKGVNPENLSYKGFGKAKPIASNKTAKGRAENRRTEIVHVGTIYEGKL